jgi:SEFIR domain
MSGPKTFISYSWTSKDHERWVLDLATALRDNGVDVILDKWDLREGHDAI